MATILVVEDEVSIRTGVERLLRLEGYTVYGAEDGRGGLLQAVIVKPDLVLTDIHMPFIDGFALLAEIRQSDDLAHVPVIMLTAADDRATRKRAMDAGASDYVTKPFRREHLLMAIKTQLELASDRKAQ
ncbi:MAG: response regulator [Burkholderiaceae bacterium]|nr:response regulator [Burkholderiaceae bacterium]